MKNSLVFILALLIIFSCVACENKSNNQAEGIVENAPAVTQTTTAGTPINKGGFYNSEIKGEYYCEKLG